MQAVLRLLSEQPQPVEQLKGVGKTGVEVIRLLVEYGYSSQDSPADIKAKIAQQLNLSRRRVQQVVKSVRAHQTELQRIIDQWAI